MKYGVTSTTYYLNYTRRKHTEFISRSSKLAEKVCSYKDQRASPHYHHSSRLVYQDIIRCNHIFNLDNKYFHRMIEKINFIRMYEK